MKISCYSCDKMKLPIFTDEDVCIVVENQFFEKNKDLIEPFFGEVTPIVVPPETDMWDILVNFQFFAKRSDAKKNWKNSGMEIPDGWNEFLAIGKKRRNLWVWKPL